MLEEKVSEAKKIELTYKYTKQRHNLFKIGKILCCNILSQGRKNFITIMIPNMIFHITNKKLKFLFYWKYI